MPSPSILVTGATGFLGPWAVAELARRGCPVVTTARRGGDLACDLTAPGAVARLLSEVEPGRVLHLAALSSMAACAAEPERARATNAGVAAELARRLGPRLLYVSTDLVFDGARAPYEASAAPAPLSVYGRTKAEGEALALAAGSAVARLPLLFGPDEDGRGASEMVLRAVRRRTPLDLYTNEFRTPLLAAEAARGLADLLLGAGLARITHLPGPERISRFEFGRRLCAVLGLDPTVLQPAECDDPTRPRDVSLAGAWEPGFTLDEALRLAVPVSP